MVDIKLLVEGGKMTPTPAVAQQLGPMGINMGQVISDVNSKTGDFKGMNVPVVLKVDAATKNYSIEVLSPPTSELLKKELGISKASGNRIQIKVGNLPMERVIFVAKQKHNNMLSKDLLASIRSVLGTCQAMGIIVDNKEIKEILEDINEGKYDAMIKAEKVVVDEEKKNELKEFFSKIEKEQEATKQALEGSEDKASGGKKKKK